MKPSLLILAAGMWSRYWGLKQIDPIGPHNEVIIDYSIYDAIKAWFEKVVFVIRRDIEKDFKEFFWSRFEKYIQVEYVYQELDVLPEGFSVPEGRTKPRGTWHAVLMAKDSIKEPFAMINADDFYGRESFEVMYKFLSENNSGDIYSLIGYHLENTVSPYGSVNRGVCATQDGNLVDVVETKDIQTQNGQIGFFNENNHWTDLSPETIVSMNFFGFMPSLFGRLESWFLEFLKQYGQEQKSEYYIPFLLDQLVKNNTIVCKVIPNKASWFGVTYKEDKPEVVASIQKLIQSWVYPEKLWS